MFMYHLAVAAPVRLCDMALHRSERMNVLLAQRLPLPGRHMAGHSLGRVIVDSRTIRLDCIPRTHLWVDVRQTKTGGTMMIEDHTVTLVRQVRHVPALVTELGVGPCYGLGTIPALAVGLVESVGPRLRNLGRDRVFSEPLLQVLHRPLRSGNEGAHASSPDSARAHAPLGAVALEAQTARTQPDEKRPRAD